MLYDENWAIWIAEDFELNAFFIGLYILLNSITLLQIYRTYKRGYINWYK